MLHFQYLTCVLGDFPELESLFPRVQGTLSAIICHSPARAAGSFSLSVSVCSPHSHGTAGSLMRPIRQHFHQAQMNLTPIWQLGPFFGNNRKQRILAHIPSTQPFLVWSQLCAKTKLICIAGCFYYLQGQQWCLKPRKTLTSAGEELWLWCRGAEPGS